MRSSLAITFSLLSQSVVEGTWYNYSGTNSVDGCGMVCVDSTDYICLGTLSTADLCASACQAHPTCALYTWSSGSKHCWTRRDTQWNPSPSPGSTSGCDSDKVKGGSSPCGPPVPHPKTTNLTATIDASVALGKTSPLHPAVALDFWRSDDPTFGEKWGHSSALTIDLTSPVLRAAAKALAPAVLRLGGSPEDSLVFDEDGTGCVPQSGGNGPYAPYFCSQVHPYVYDCITKARWLELLAFAADTGLKIALGLNGCYGRPSATLPMDYTNAAAIFNATASSPHAADGFFGFELTNEVVPNTISAAAWGKDAAALKDLARVTFAAAGLAPPPMVGPDQSCCNAQSDVMAATPPGVISALTYHEYPECTDPGVASGLAMSPSCLSAIDRHAAGAVAAAATGTPPPPVWLGEGADHSGGGVPGLTDTFRSSYYTSWLYGASAAAGVELMARQCLSGGDYELLQRDGGGFAPNPDFWVVYLFKQLIGGVSGASAFNVTHSTPPTSSGVRVFAFSPAQWGGSQGSGGGGAPTLALLALNLQIDTPVEVTLGGGGVGGDRVEYHLSGNASAVHGDVACNGKVLAMDSVTHAPPPVQGLGVSAPGGSPLILQPGGIAFVTIA